MFLHARALCVHLSSQRAFNESEHIYHFFLPVIFRASHTQTDGTLQHPSNFNSHRVFVWASSFSFLFPLVSFMAGFLHGGCLCRERRARFTVLIPYAFVVCVDGNPDKEGSSKNALRRSCEPVCRARPGRHRLTRVQSPARTQLLVTMSGELEWLPCTPP